MFSRGVFFGGQTNFLQFVDQRVEQTLRFVVQRVIKLFLDPKTFVGRTIDFFRHGTRPFRSMFGRGGENLRFEFRLRTVLRQIARPFVGFARRACRLMSEIERRRILEVERRLRKRRRIGGKRFGREGARARRFANDHRFRVFVTKKISNHFDRRLNVARLRRRQLTRNVTVLIGFTSDVQLGQMRFVLDQT